MGRIAPRPRPGRRVSVERLEGRALLTAAGNLIAPLAGVNATSSITALDSNGFTPTSLHVNGAAALSGSRLRLTDGGLNENASAFSTVPVDVSQAFSTTFQFQLTPDGDAPLGSGFTFDIQNRNGVSDLNTGSYDSLGLTVGSHVAISFATYDPNPYPDVWKGLAYSDNATGLYIGNAAPSFTDSTQVAIPETLIDLHSGHVFQATISYTPPAGSSQGTISETILDTVTGLSWSHTYQGVNIQAGLANNDTNGQYAYAGFTASTGSPANNGGPAYIFGKGHSTQDVLNWSWSGSDLSGGIASEPYGGTFTVAATETTAGAVFDANGNLVRTLWQDAALDPGTYRLAWDGLNQYGQVPNPATNPGPYTFRVVVGGGTAVVRTIGNDTTDPSVNQDSINALTMYGVAVSPDGSSIWAAQVGADTAGGGSLKAFDGSGDVDLTSTSQSFNYDYGLGVAMDNGYLYEIAEINGYTGEFGLLKVNLNANDDESAGFTDNGHANPDGSVNKTSNGVNYLSILTGLLNNQTALRGVAVTDGVDPSQGSVFVTDNASNLVRRYDKVTGDQIGTPFSVQDPTGIAVGPDGNLWIAHDPGHNGMASMISVYTPSGVLVRNVTEASGLANVASLAVANGKLYVADNGGGRVLVYGIEGDQLINGASPQQIGSPASFGNDNGQTTFWGLNGVTADAQGNVYTVQSTLSTAPGQGGSQIEKWSPQGQVIWVKGGYEYQAVVGASSPTNPTTVYSSSLHRYTIDPTTGAWEYTGSVAYPGFNSNKWSGLPVVGDSAAPTFVTIGGSQFLTIANHDRVIFYKFNADGSLHPAGIVGGQGLADGDAWTWTDTLGDGVPQDSQIVDAGTNGGIPQLTVVDAKGDVFYYGFDGKTGAKALFELPSLGLDAHGNPVFNWSKAVELALLPATFKTFVVGTDGIYLEYNDAAFGPVSSTNAWSGYSTGGANALSKLSLTGKALWTIPLPDPSNNLGAVPGGGVIVGGMVGSNIYEVSGDGQLVATFAPLTTGDWLDYTGGAMVVTRNPNDGMIDVFTEGIGFSDNEWYRIDDQGTSTVLHATAVAGATVTLGNPPAAPSALALSASDDSGVKNDGLTNVRQPHLTGTAAAGTTVQIVDASGNVIATGQAGADGTFSLTPSAPLADGTYALHASATSTGGTSDFGPTFTLVIDGTPPAAPAAPALLAADDSGTAGDGVTNVRQPRLTGTATAGATVTVVDPSGNTLATAVAGAGGSYTIQLPAPLADGSYAFRVEQTDAAGNTSSASAALTLVIDATAPAAPPAPTLLASDSPGARNTTNVRQPHLTGTAEPNSVVQLLIAGNVVGTAKAGADGSYTVQAGSPLADGTYTLSVRATDAAGNVGPAGASVSVVVDATPPPAPSAIALSVTDDSGAAGDGLTNVRQPHLTGTAQALATVAIVNGAGAIVGLGTAAANGTFSVAPSAALADGTYALHAVAVDAAGNVSPSGPAFTLVIDATPPPAPSAPALAAADAAPAPGFTASKQPHLTGTAEAGATVRLLNAAGNVVGTAKAGADGSYNVQVASPLADGTYTLAAQATDAAGNAGPVGPSLTVTVVSTLSAPSALTLLPADDSGAKGDLLTNVNRPRLTGVAPAGATLQLMSASGAVLGTAVAGAGGAFTLQPTAALPDGADALWARVLGASGLVSPAGPTLTLNVKTSVAAPSAPTLLAADDSAPVGDGKTSVRQPRFTGSAPAGAAVSLLNAQGVVIGTATATTAGTYVVQPTNSLAFGANTLSVRVQDAAGNVSAASGSTSLSIVDATSDDFNGDGKSDLVVVRPATAQWFIRSSSGSTSATFGMTNLGDIAVPGDYDGTGHIEMAVFRPSTAQWFIDSPSGVRVVSFGGPNMMDIPVPGDYDGVGHTELAVYRVSTAQWFVLGPNGSHVVAAFGGANLFDIPVPGDYDGVGHTEPAVFRPSTAQWIVLGPNGSHVVAKFGAMGLSDLPAPGDYDGVGHTEPAVFRPSTSQWFVLGPNGSEQFASYGAPNLADLPAAGTGASLKKMGAIGGTISALGTPTPVAAPATTVAVAAPKPVVATAAATPAPAAAVKPKLAPAQEAALETALRTLTVRSLLSSREG